MSVRVGSYVMQQLSFPLLLLLLLLQLLHGGAAVPPTQQLVPSSAVAAAGTTAAAQDINTSAPSRLSSSWGSASTAVDGKGTLSWPACLLPSLKEENVKAEHQDMNGF
jgi:hypothetical protein